MYIINIIPNSDVIAFSAGDRITGIGYDTVGRSDLFVMAYHLVYGSWY